MRFGFERCNPTHRYRYGWRGGRRAGLSIAVEASSPVKLDGGWKAKILKAKDTRAKPVRGASYQPVTFADLPGWAQDDHLAAFKTFLNSCQRVIANAREKAAADKGPAPPTALVAACSEASRLAGEIKSKDSARAFFELQLHAECG